MSLNKFSDDNIKDYLSVGCNKINCNELKVAGKNNPRAKKYIFISPDGKKHIIEGGVKKFCKEIGITYDAVLGKKSKNTKGWTIINN